MTTLSKDEKLSLQQDEAKELQDQQKAGNIKKVPANIDKSILIYENEVDGYVHVLVTEKNLSSTGKEFIETTKVISFHNNLFARQVAQGALQLFDEARVVHDPRKERPKTAAEYNLKPMSVSAEPTPTPTVKGAKGADMKIINEQRKDLEAREAALDEKEAAAKERIDNRAKELNDREAALVEREKSLGK